MSELLQWWRAGTLALGGGAALSASLVAAGLRPSLRPRIGHRGAMRRRALAAGGLFAPFEPCLRLLAGIVGGLPLQKLRAQQERELRRADHPLGLMPDELTALSAIAAVLMGVAGWVIGAQLDLNPMSPMLLTVLGALLPSFQLREQIRMRSKEITRGLPHAIEIVAMCMGAGHDFPGALRLVAAPQGKNQTALSRELTAVLEHLELGHTRREALLSFAERVPAESVRDFVNAVIQAEQRGNPLAKVIQVQGRMLNLRRSVAAEEAAARAAVMLVAPMLVLVCCILLLLLGPFVVKGIGF